MKIIIDGKTLEVDENRTILDAARENGIFIPSLCDHPRLEPFTGCRLCIVEISGRKGFPPSCGTYVQEGMEVRTDTPRLRRLRKQILELILSEHPNACLICREKENCDDYKSTIRKVGDVTGCVLCPNNGRCELQEVVEALKINRVRFPSLYRQLDVKKTDSFFDRDYNLCILCGRCVRVCHEVRGASAISIVFRGSQAVVSTVLDRPLVDAGCQLCGACVDICPTGALFERATRYETLPDAESRTICAYCSMGCTLCLELNRGRLTSTHPEMDGKVNQGQACIRGRFTIRDVVSSSRRIRRPLIRKGKELVDVSWEEALDYAAQKMKEYRGKEVAVVTSPHLSCEDNYTLHKFAREVLKTRNVWTSSHYCAFSAMRQVAEKYHLPLDMNYRIKDISEAKILFLIEEELCASHPIVWLEVLEAVKNGARLIVVASSESPSHRHASLSLYKKSGAEVLLFHFLSKFLLEITGSRSLSHIKGFKAFQNFLGKLDPSQAASLTGIKEEVLREASRLLAEGRPSLFLFGSHSSLSPSAEQSLVSLWNLAVLSGGRLVPLGSESNSRGAHEIARHFPSRYRDFHPLRTDMESGTVKALYLAGPVPPLGKKRPDFLVIQDSFMSENTVRADVIFPAATFVETDGIFVNTEGRLQRIERIIKEHTEAKPDWWITSQLAVKMGKKDFLYRKSSQILKEIANSIPSFAKVSPSSLKKGKEAFIREKEEGEKKFILTRVTHLPVQEDKRYPYLLFLDYSLDYYRSLSLSEEIRGLRAVRDSRWIMVSQVDAKKLRLEDGEEIVVESSEGKCRGIVRVSATLPKGMMKTFFLWNSDRKHAVAELLSSSSSKLPSLGPVYVRIKRGK
ncbi:MAG: molybdopterin-dependent oxidoreductase [Candidatus Aminicenantales bacterium]